MKKNLLLLLSLITINLFAQDCDDLFISEYVEGPGNNNAIEIYNPTNDEINLDGYTINRYGNGSQTRSFCYISDMAEGLIKLMNGNYIGPINLGNPDEYTILELATIIHKMTKSNAQLIYKELPKDDPKKRQPDITKAKFHLDWQPQFSLERGLELTIQHFQDQLFE